MCSKDIALRLCSSDPIYVDGVPIYPLALRKIAKIGYERFSEEMKFLCLNESDISLLAKKDISDVGLYVYLVGVALKDSDLMNKLVFWLSQITHSQISFSRKKMCFCGDSFEIKKENFQDIQNVIRLRNGMQDITEEEENPDNDAARRVLLRRKEERLKRKKIKTPDEESALTLDDLVSIFASGMKMSMDEVMKYDLYQFNNQFNRLKIMDDYEVNVLALLHGAKKENVNLTHWITKIKRDED